MIFYSKKINKINGLKSFFFSRGNGLSKGIYQSLNCGLGSNDKKKNVKRKKLYGHGKSNGRRCGSFSTY